MMIAELKKAIEKAELLPEANQQALAHLILSEIEWEISFARSKDQLVNLANEALAEYKKGKAKPLDFVE
ncbi:MAG: hypothetical protein JST43_00970 [Bacteroidetes bacterium]|nr:hypothetical protein [Bacteroidota bacterium]MBS1540670.1 hypothetical protein [Bacteroidota bacterium]